MREAEAHRDDGFTHSAAWSQQSFGQFSLRDNLETHTHTHTHTHTGWKGSKNAFLWSLTAVMEIK